MITESRRWCGISVMILKFRRRFGVLAMMSRSRRCFRSLADCRRFRALAGWSPGVVGWFRGLVGVTKILPLFSEVSSGSPKCHSQWRWVWCDKIRRQEDDIYTWSSSSLCHDHHNHHCHHTGLIAATQYKHKNYTSKIYT